jgi:cell division protein ZapA (FtsZ GTPase activity inhibitor)
MHAVRASPLISAYLVNQKGKMMKFKMTIGASVVVMAALLVVLSGCQKQEGPAEKAGQKIDKAVEKAGEKIDQTTEKLGEKVEKAGENIQDAAKRDEKK